jgi:hypothetical protein
MTSDEHSHLDSESQSLLQELGATPVMLPLGAQGRPGLSRGRGSAPGRVRPLSRRSGPSSTSPLLLYHTGDGSRPEHYPVDVHPQAGALLETNSPGVNVPHLGVHYWRSIYGANYDPSPIWAKLPSTSTEPQAWPNRPCVASIPPRPDEHGAGGADAAGFAVRSRMRLREEKQ